MGTYQKILNIWQETVNFTGHERIRTTQYEVAYTEYNDDGSVHHRGSEDFSPQRYKMDVAEKLVWVWDGKSYNRGGHKSWTDMGFVKIRRRDMKAYRRMLINTLGCTEVQFR